MNNPIADLLDQTSRQSQSQIPQRENNLKQTLDILRNSDNPQAMFQLLLNTNPQLKQVMAYVQQNGGDPKTAFYKLAKTKGVDPDEVLKMLK